MYVITLSYVKPIDEVDAQLMQHREYLAQQYAKELFVASGPKVPRDGGIILASGKLTRAELDALIAEDPFHQHGLARYEIVEFDAVKYHPAIAHMV